MKNAFWFIAVFWAPQLKFEGAVWVFKNNRDIDVHTVMQVSLEFLFWLLQREILALLNNE